MHRFFVDKENIGEKSIIIENEEFKHLKNVLRLGVGDKIIVCDGDNFEYLSLIEEIDDLKAIAKILNVKKSNKESDINIRLYQGIPKGDKMDFIIQKATELGVKEIYPVEMKRSVVKLVGKKREKRRDRWSKIAKESAKQCGRGLIPEIADIDNFEKTIKNVSKDDLNLFLYEDEKETGFKKTLRDNNKYKNINIFVGPEGGFEKEEVQKIEEILGKRVSLGTRILRTETVSLAVISIIQYELGDLGEI